MTILKTTAAITDSAIVTPPILLSDTAVDVDGGTKAHAHATATLVAPAGYFIFIPTLKTNHKGSAGYRSTQTKFSAHKNFPNKLGKTVAAQKISVTVNSKDVGRLGDAHAKSVSTATALAYPNDQYADVVAAHLAE